MEIDGGTDSQTDRCGNGSDISAWKIDKLQTYGM